MSLAIDPAAITDVLLADGWHHVEDESFTTDALSLGDREEDGTFTPLAALGIGFRFEETVDFDARTRQAGGRRSIVGPLSSLIAARHRP